ncbi:MAG: DUF4331 domain-containing protein [Acidobacteria bacterium]|nr:DUF4331 domain-containing protein [Acidobacteriota bacterium]
MAPSVAAFNSSRAARASLPASATDPNAVIGVWSTASRFATRRLSPGAQAHSGALVQVSRLGNPLVNEAVITAEAHLRGFIKNNPGHYEAQRMLAGVLLSQHRFAEAITQANKVNALDPRDAWNHGAIGDGSFELGDYERAFAAYDRMGQLQPGPPAYARTAHALEIKGDLAGSLEYMKRAADGSWSNDPESQAWHYAQLGDLLLQQGRVGDAKREYEHAAVTFPNHPLAMIGLAKVKIADGDLDGARLTYQEQLARVPTPDLAIAVGDLLEARGDAAGAEQYYRMAEQIERAAWGNGPAQPQALARFLAEHDRKLPEALTLAEEAVVSRRDIFTMDTLAWNYFKAGRLAEADKAMVQAQRTAALTRESCITRLRSKRRWARGPWPRKRWRGFRHPTRSPTCASPALSRRSGRACRVREAGGPARRSHSVVAGMAKAGWPRRSRAPESAAKAGLYLIT